MSEPRRACVIGWPIKHSRSPLIHGYWLTKYGIEGSYEKIAVAPDDFEHFVRNLGSAGYHGCNVTLPHKERVLLLADVVSEAATAVGAANTLWLAGERVHATNTDVTGFMTHLKLTVPGWRAAAAPAVVFGAGGAARAVVHGLVEAGVPEIRIVNRSPERARDVAARRGSAAKVMAWEHRDLALEGAGLLVNTTTLGMAGQPIFDIDLGRLPATAVVADNVYVPLETKLLAEARRLGLPTVDGLGMLLHQAVPGFELWFGVRPEVTPELRQLVKADIESA